MIICVEERRDSSWQWIKCCYGSQYNMKKEPKCSKSKIVDREELSTFQNNNHD